MSSVDTEREKYSEFMERMVSGFDRLIASHPVSVDDVIEELRKEDEFITLLDPIQTSVPGMAPSELPSRMQRYGYYASIQGPLLVCSKSRKRHDKMLFAAQASQVLAEANMMLVPLPSH